MNRRALIVIDMQRALIDDPPRPHEAQAVIERINALSEAARRAGAPVVFVRHEGPGGPLERGSDGWTFARGLAVDESDHIVSKTTTDGFLRTGLSTLLEQQRVEELVIAGYASEFCVDTTVRRAAALGYPVTLVSDAHTTHDKPHASGAQIRLHHNATLADITSFGPRIVPVSAADVRFGEALEDRLVELVRGSAWFMRLLQSARELGLASWCIGAGAVRTLVWDHLHGFEAPSRLPDVDLAYFDPSVLATKDPASAARAQARRLQRTLSILQPDIAWEAVNQAAVHLGLRDAAGEPASPHADLADAIAAWPEFATAVGVTLRTDDRIDVIAPFGLADLFGALIRHNPRHASVDVYRERVRSRRFDTHWPKVRVITE